MPGFVIPTINQGETDPNVMLKQLLNAYIILTEELTYLLNNLDTKNMNEIDGDILVTGTVTAGKMNVGELSAISADLGKITSGEIYGAYIATREQAFPRAEMSNTKDMFATYQSDNSYIQIKAVNAGSNSPQMTIVSPDGSLNFYQSGSASNIFTTGIDLRLNSSGDITFTPGYFGRVYVPFDQLTDFNTSTTLDQKLTAKATRGISTSLSGGHNHGIPAGAQFQAVDGTIYTWYPAENHSHAQN